ncbi:flavin reductase family protein, partial [Streptomyces sp. NPDC005091]
MADERGIPVLQQAHVVLNSTTHARNDGGDHTILVGRVDDAVLGGGILPSTSAAGSTPFRRPAEPFRRL